jgi:hypothetical protein
MFDVPFLSGAKRAEKKMSIPQKFALNILNYFKIKPQATTRAKLTFLHNHYWNFVRDNQESFAKINLTLRVTSVSSSPLFAKSRQLLFLPRPSPAQGWPVPSE